MDEGTKFLSDFKGRNKEGWLNQFAEFFNI